MCGPLIVYIEPFYKKNLYMLPGMYSCLDIYFDEGKGNENVCSVFWVGFPNRYAYGYSPISNFELSDYLEN
jgi:hypothetical protein